MAGVYLSYPFCQQKCSYCNFASGVYPRDLARRYLAALRREIQSHSWKWIPETVYLGGGTPGDMEEGELVSLLELIPGKPWREATIEAAPGSITEQKVHAWRRAGINRVSLGVQSFVPEELRPTGRKHDAETVAREVTLLREGGIESINVDLIAGLPHQTVQSWRTSLRWIERLEVPHVSVYMLEVDEDSRLGKEILHGGQRYGAPQAPSDEQTAELYEIAVGELARMGLSRYEISNFARPGWESVHNLKYWRLEPYAGFGADAHSFDGTTRCQNAETAPDYVGRMERLGSACVGQRPARFEEERFFVGLRLSDGVRLQDGEAERLTEKLRRHFDQGLLEIRHGRLRLSPRGVMLSNEALQEFLTDEPNALD
ncbi:MAG: radical SAM family heme chaperone HemW [Bryobacteraceae bacterium]